MRNGHVVLMPNEGVLPTRGEVESALAGAGLPRWNGDDFPLVAILHNMAGKGDFFECGFWAGAGVPVIFLGGSARAARRGHLIQRFGGWSVVGANNTASVEDLLAMVAKILLKG